MATALGLMTTLIATSCGQPAPEKKTIAIAQCDLNATACNLTSRWGPLKLELTPRPLPTLRPITVRLTGADHGEIAATARLDGLDMDMGPNVVQLRRVEAGPMEGQLTIPVCLTGTMKWQLTLQLKDPRGEESFRFDFEAPVAR